MSRILAIDYGIKRCGLAATDPLQIIVTPLKAIETDKLLAFLQLYLKEESVEKIIFGLPVHKDGNPTYLKKHIDTFITKLKKEFVELPIDFQDESFSSFEAKEIIKQSGAKKKKRQDKSLVDTVSAVLILQRYLKHID